MNRDAFIQRCFGDRLQTDKHQGGYPFITISRQAGAGGDELADMIVRETESRAGRDLFSGWKVFDRDLCTLIAEEGDLDVVVEELLDEEYHSQFSEFINDFMRSRSSQYDVLKRTFQMIRTLTSVGKVVIVGRGASFVTRDLPGAINLRLVASEEKRIQRMMSLMAADEATVKRELRRRDAERTKFIRDYFMSDIDDPLHYDIVWNTGAEPTDFLAKILTSMIEEKGVVTTSFV